MQTDKLNVFVLGMNDFNRNKLLALPEAEECHFHNLLTMEESHGASTYDVEKLMEKAVNKLDSFTGSIDAIIGFWDFPISIMQTLLAERFSTRGTSPQSVLRCEQKHWSRLKQQDSVPELVPAFCAFDPFDDNPREAVRLDYPFWVKPVKSFGGHLGFRIESDEDFDFAVGKLRQNVSRFADPLRRLMNYTDPPRELPEEDPRTCLAEEILTGRQCTLEGYAFKGEVHTHGIIDSHRFAGMSCFSYFQYPSALPSEICSRMKKAAGKVMSSVEFNNSAFNIEFLWDEETDRLKLLEINPRIAQSHADLFEKVDGCSNHRIILDIARGRRPEMPFREGPCNVAGKFFVRHFKNGIVKSAPGEQDVRRLKDAIPGIHVSLRAEEGRELAELDYQDSYSYKLAILYFGGDSPEDLQDKFELAKDILGYQIEDF